MTFPTDIRDVLARNAVDAPDGIYRVHAEVWLGPEGYSRKIKALHRFSWRGGQAVWPIAEMDLNKQNIVEAGVRQVSAYVAFGWIFQEHP